MQLHLGEAVERLRKAARDRPAREQVPSATGQTDSPARESESAATSDWEADVVIGAALVYGPHHAESLATCIARLLQPVRSDHDGAIDGPKKALIVQIPTRPVRPTPIPSPIQVLRRYLQGFPICTAFETRLFV